MPFKNKPCAYCGRTDVRREKGHVIPEAMYPSTMDPTVQYRTVPECIVCKQIWQDAEAHFRTVAALCCGVPNADVMEQWDGPITRSFSKPSGKKWVTQLREMLVPVKVDGVDRHKVYPAEDEQVMFVARKILRGLCHYHKLGTAISDDRVHADVLRESMPDDVFTAFTVHVLKNSFCSYAYLLLDPESGYHSAWLLCFYGKMNLVGGIAAERVVSEV